MKTDTIATIRSVVVWVGMAVYLILWCKLPEMVGIHFGRSCSADTYGSKQILLLPVFLPLIAYFPIYGDEPPELHGPDSEELYKEFLKDEKRKGKWIQLSIAILTVSVNIFVMVMVMKSK